MLDEKVSRLPPEEQRMVEEFVVFLLSRQGRISPYFLDAPPFRLPGKVSGKTNHHGR